MIEDSRAPAGEQAGAGPPVATLDAEIAEAVQRLRAAYADLLAAIPERTGRAIDVERALGLDKKLAWQVFRVATAGDPLSAGARVPGAAAARRVVRAARRHGVSPDVARRLEESTGAFHDAVRRHAGDRSSFDLMVSAVTGDGLAARDEELKRAAFRANRQLLGKYCDADVFTLLVHPGDRPGTVHMCSLRGLVNLYRLRPMTRLEISRHRFDRSDGSVQEREAIDAADDDAGAPPIALLGEFCDPPLPEIRQVPCPDGFVRSFFETASLGLRSAVTCFLADVVRNSPLVTKDEPAGTAAVGHIHEIATPARLLYHDCLIDDRICDDVSPELRIIANRRDAGTWPGDDRSVLLPVQEDVIRAGRGAATVAAPQVPRYPQMIKHITDRLGWDPDRFVLHRARIEHPVLNSVVWMRFDLSRSSVAG
jgi:hypothetical protein